MSRRGVAMLIVLVVLLVAVTAATGVARVSVVGRIAERQSSNVMVCEDLQRQAEEACRNWLVRESERTVLPPDRERPSLPIIADSMTTASDKAQISVLAVDLMGMIPADRLEGSLGATVPSDIRRALRGRPAGEDGGGAYALDRELLRRPLFPPGLQVERDVFGMGDQELSGPRTPREPAALHADASVCETVAFARVGQSRRIRRRDQSESVALNVNTTPAPLLEAACSLAGVEAIDAILRSRAEGVPAALDFRIESGSEIRFVSRSHLWGFRIDTSMSGASSAWWVVFEQAGGAWRVARRVLIDE